MNIWKYRCDRCGMYEEETVPLDACPNCGEQEEFYLISSEPSPFANSEPDSEQAS